LGLGAFAALDDLKLYFLVFFQGPKPFSLDIAVVDKDIGTVSLGDEAIPLGIAEPLYFTAYSHYQNLQNIFPSSRGAKVVRLKKTRGTAGIPFLLFGKAYGPAVSLTITLNIY
jgi:hypothetical protein